MTFDMAEAALAAQDARIPMILIGDGGAAFVPDASRPGLTPAEAAPTLQQALAQTPPCGCAGRAAPPADILSLPGPAAELVIPEPVPVDREPGYRRLAEDLRGHVTAPWLIEPEAAIPLAPLIEAGTGAGATKDTLLRAESTSAPVPGEDFDDANGNGQWDPDETIYGTGTRPTVGFDTGFWTDSGGGGGGGGTPGGSASGQPAPTPPDMECLSAEEKSQLSDKEREAYEVAEQAAKIFREIMQKADRDLVEYGALIYRDMNGVITHTPITRGGPTSVSPEETGLTRYGDLLAIVHLHTAATWTGNDFKLFPTPGPAGDWTAFDGYANGAYTELRSRGYSHEDAMAHVASMHQFVIGPKGEMGSNLYELRKYEGDDRDTLTLGQKIPENLGQCG